MRSYQFGPLKNRNPQKLGSLAVPASYASSSLWSLPPKTVAQFAGELSRVMLAAAENYVYERTLAMASKNFRREAWRDTARGTASDPPKN